MSAARCAQLIVTAMRRRQRLLITSARGRLGRWARLLVPRRGGRLGDARHPRAALAYSKAMAGRSSAMRKYSNRYWITRSWLCSR